MTTFTGQPGQNNAFVGGAGADSFLFAVADLDAGDTLNGGGGTDTLVLSGTGTLAASRLAGLASIEAIGFANGGIGLVFTDAVATALGGFVTVAGSAGDDLFDYGAVTLVNRAIGVTAGSGNDTLRGGAANDSFRFAIAELTAADTVSGGAGIDTLFLDTAGTITAANLAGVSGVERITLANGANAVTLAAGIAAGLAAPLTVNGNAGNDTINAAALVDGTSRVEFISGGGLDALTGGTGNDTFRFAAGDLAGDTVNGGLGYDTVIVAGADDLTVADLAKVSSVEQFTLSAAGGSLTLSNAISLANAITLNIYGAAGNDSVDATAVTNGRGIIVVAGAGSDTLRGGTGSDNFRFNVADLDATDVLVGGGGVGLDQISFANAGTITAAALSGAQGIERLSLSAGTNAVTLTDAFVGTASGTQVSVLGTAGNETIDASALTGTNRIDYTASAGNDAVTGGAGDDIFRFALTALSAADTIVGGLGYDDLKLTSNGQLGAAALAGVSGIEQITFGVANTNLILNDAVANANAARLRIFASTGNDLIDASAVLSGARSISVVAAGGSDTIRGSAGGDIIQFAAADLTSADIVAGNAGSDQIQITSAGTIAAASFANVTGVEAIVLQVGGIGLGLADAMVGSAGGLVTVTGSSGNDTVDASALTGANRVTIDAGAGNDTLTGGAGADNFRFAAANLTAADTVAGGTGSDTLTLNAAGTVALAGNVTGIETLALGAAGVTATIGDAFAAVNGPALAVTGTSGNDTVDASAVTLAGFALATTSGAGNDTLKGGAGNDVFRFGATALNSADKVNGGGGFDTLEFTTGGTILAGQFAGTAGIEAITLAAGAVTSIALDNAALANNAVIVFVQGTDGNDTVDASAATVTDHALSIRAGGGDDTLKGGAGADTFNFDGGQLTAADIVQGGGGIAQDRLILPSSGQIVLSAADLAGVSGIERIESLTPSGLSLQLTASMFATAYARTITVTGTSGNDSIDASAASDTATLDVDAANGDDVLTGGAGLDRFTFYLPDFTAGDRVDGGAGFDSLALYGAGGGSSTVDFTVANGLSGIELIQVSDGGDTTVVLGSANADSLSGNVLNVIVGEGASSDTVDASRLNGAGVSLVVFTGDGGDTVIDSTTATGAGPGDSLSGDLGAGDDVVQAVAGIFDAYDLEGGAGDDTIELTAQSDTFTKLSASVTGFETVNLVTANGSAQYFSANDSAGLKVVGATPGANIYVKLGNGGQKVFGNGGNDEIVGGTGSDTLVGGPGNDVLDGFGGADVVSGGIGNDTARYRADATAITGGSETDTLVALNGGTFDLSAGDQSLNDSVAVNTFENFNGLSFEAENLAAYGDLNGYAGESSTAAVVVTGTTGVNRIGGTSYADVLDGNGGADAILGFEGADRITYRGTETSIHAYYAAGYADQGAGDTLVLRASATVRLDQVDQTLNDATFVNAFQNVDGTLANAVLDLGGDGFGNVLTGGSRDDVLSGGGGNDTLDGGGGIDALNGDAGNDRVWHDRNDQSIQGGDGTDTLLLRAGGTFDLMNPDQSSGDNAQVAGFENVDASAATAAVTLAGRKGFGSILIGGSAGDTITSRGSLSVLIGGGGADTLIGSVYDDQFRFRAGDVVAGETITGNAGTDSVTASGNNDFTGATISGVEIFQISSYDYQLADNIAGPITVTLTGAQATAFAKVRNDGNYGEADKIFVNVASGTTALLASIIWTDFEDGADRLTVNGAAGNETISVPNVVTTLIYANGGNDTLLASPNWAYGSFIFGDAGNDRISYGAASDQATIDGGADSDTLTVSYGFALATTVIDLALADQTVGDDNVVSSFENVDWSNVAQVYGYGIDAKGTAGANTLIGSEEGDLIDGRGGADALDGKGGNDRIVYAAGAATIAGGNGTDTLVVRGAATLDLGLSDQSSSDAANTTGFENIDASGSAAAVVMIGRPTFHSTLIGGSAGDTIVANDAGADIIGGAGADTLKGGIATDNFYFAAEDVVAGESIAAAGNADYAYVSGSNDFTGATISGLESLYLTSKNQLTGVTDTTPIAVTLTGAQAAGLSSIRGTIDAPDRVDLVTINVASGTTVSFSKPIFASFGAEDGIVINGAAGNETIGGVKAKVTIRAGAGNDTLNVYQDDWHDSTVYGDAGDDRIDYANHSATLDGGADSDTLVATADSGNAEIDLSAADQSLGGNVVASGFENVDWSAVGAGFFYRGIYVTGSAGANRLIGSANRDYIDGAGGADTIDAGGGDDQVVYDAADLSVAGGAGNDTLVVRGSGNINLAAADQGVGDAGTLTGFENVNAANGSVAVRLRGRDDYASTLSGGRGDDTITAGDAGAVIEGNEGADTLIGGIGVDGFYVFPGAVVAGDTIDGAGGDSDYIRTFYSIDLTAATVTRVEQLQIRGDTSSTVPTTVTLTGAQAAAFSLIQANNGATSYANAPYIVNINVAWGSTVSLAGTLYKDFVTQDQINVNGAAGDETITGPTRTATIHGNAGADRLIGSWDGLSAIYGDAGADRIDYGYPDRAVTIDGGADVDTLVGSANVSYGGVAINLALADQTTGDAATVTGFENVDWSALSGGINATGSAAANSLLGGGGSDRLDGAGGADTIMGGNGNDFIVYDADDTLVQGNGGADWLVVGGAVNVDLAAADQVAGDAGTLSGFENVDGRQASAAITARGSSGFVSTLVGGASGDTLIAGAAGANLFGGGGADTLTGSAAIDNIYLFAGDFAAGEKIDGKGGGDSLSIGADTDLRIGTVGGIANLNLAAAGYQINADGYLTILPQNGSVTVTLSGAQTAGFTAIKANLGTTSTTETVNVQLAGGTTDLGSVSLAGFSGADRFNVNGTTGNDTYFHVQNGTVGAIHGYEGDDRLGGEWAGALVYGDAGNDTIDYAVNAAVNTTIDGGADRDTLVLAGTDNVAVDLSAADQTTGDTTNVVRFENIDGSAASYAVTLKGDAGANLIIGSNYADTLTGGAGQDTFQFAARSGTLDTISDFLSVDDTLQFRGSAFDFNGAAFDASVNDTNGHAAIGSADLIRYTGGTLNNVSDVSAYLAANGTGTTGEGAFIVGQNSAGQTLLFHTNDAHGIGGDVALVANLGAIGPGALVIGDFVFF